VHLQAVWEELPGDAEYGKRSKEAQQQLAFMQLGMLFVPVYAISVQPLTSVPSNL
jgi:hypothetical protein